MNEKDVARFWAKVNKTAGCWLWTGATNPNGYGAFHFGGKARPAHRLAYELARGAIPTIVGADFRGTCVLHTCDTPACCNPAHLRAGTQRANIEDMVAKGRHVPLPGEANGRAKLTEAQARECHARAARGESGASIARRFRVAPRTIVNVLHGKSWPHLGLAHRVSSTR